MVAALAKAASQLSRELPLTRTKALRRRCTLTFRTHSTAAYAFPPFSTIYFSNFFSPLAARRTSLPRCVSLLPRLAPLPIQPRHVPSLLLDAPLPVCSCPRLPLFVGLAAPRSPPARLHRHAPPLPWGIPRPRCLRLPRGRLTPRLPHCTRALATGRACRAGPVAPAARNKRCAAERCDESGLLTGCPA